MSLRRCARAFLLTSSSLALAVTAAVAPAQAVVDPDVPPDARTVLEGDLTPYQWMLAAVRAPEAWSESTGSGVTVAIIDTGVDATHPDLVGRVVPGGIVKVADDGTTSIVDATLERTSNDWFGHGTHVAGIAAGDRDDNGITGVAPDAQVLPIRLLTRASQWLGPAQFLDSVSQAIDFAAAHGAGVLNLSLGAPSSHLSGDSSNDEYRAAISRVCDAVAAATSAGSVVVVSAGNDGSWDNWQSAPASCPGAVSVAAVGADLHRTYWSSFDPTVSLTAPGLSVLSGDSAAANATPADHFEESGTSMAAPVVTGVAALLAADDPSATAEAITDAMTSSAQDLGPAGRDAESGYGLVDAAAALGLAGPVARPGDFFSAWITYTGSMGEPGDGGTLEATVEAVVGWTVPAVHAVDGYTVRVFDSSGTTEHEVGGLEVRLQLPLEAAAWVQVVAHTASGDVATFPVVWSDDGGQWVPPKPVRAPNAERSRDAVLARWRIPKDTTGITAVMIVAQPLGSRRDYWMKRIAWDGVSPFPTAGRLTLPERARWSDLRVVVVTLSRVGEGAGEELGNPTTVPYPLPAWFGMHVDRVDAAGPSAFEVTGGVSRVLAKQVCGTTSCAGRRVAVRVLFGDTVAEVQTRLTAQGRYHALMWRPRGADAVRLRVLGPDDLVSGPFVRFQVRG